MKAIRSLAVLFLVYSFTPCGNAEEIVRLTNGEWSPYMSKNLKHYGVFSHIVTEAFGLEGIKVNYRFFPWKRGYEIAKKGKFDGSIGWAPTRKREEDFYFTNPVTHNKKVFFHLKNTPFKWNTIENLKGLKIGGTLGYTYGEEFDRAAKEGRIQVQYVPKETQNLKKLLKGRIDIFPVEIEIGYALIYSELFPKQAALLTHHPKPVQETPLCVVISKNMDSQRAKRLVNAFNEGLNRLKATGKYDEYIRNSRQGKYVN